MTVGHVPTMVQRGQNGVKLLFSAIVPSTSIVLEILRLLTLDPLADFPYEGPSTLESNFFGALKVPTRFL